MYQTSPWDALANRRRGVGLLSRMADPVRPFPQTDMTGQPIPAQTPLAQLPFAERPVTLNAGQIAPTLPTRPFSNVQRTAGADGAVSFPQRPGPGAPMQQGSPLQMLAPSTHQSTLWDHLGEIDPATWFQMAGAFLNAEGDPGVAFTGVGQALDGQGKRKFEDEQRGWARDEAKRAGTAFTQAQEDRKRALETYERITRDESLDPALRQAALAMGPEGIAQLMQTQVLSAGDRAEAGRFTQELDFRRTEGAADRAAQLQAARINAANNGFGRAFQSMDAETIGMQNQRAAQIQAVGLPQLQTLRQNIIEAGALGQNGQSIDYNSRITLGRVFNSDIEGRMSLETWRARILGPAIEQLRGMGAMSNVEFEAVMQAFANPDMTFGAALALVDEKIALAERQIQQAQLTSQFFNEAGGITGRRNRAGQDYATFLQEGLSAGTQRRPEAIDAAVGANVATELRADIDRRNWASLYAYIAESGEGWSTAMSNVVAMMNDAQKREFTQYFLRRSR